MWYRSGASSRLEILSVARSQQGVGHAIHVLLFSTWYCTCLVVLDCFSFGLVPLYLGNGAQGSRLSKLLVEEFVATRFWQRIGVDLLRGSGVAKLFVGVLWIRLGRMVAASVTFKLFPVWRWPAPVGMGLTLTPLHLEGERIFWWFLWQGLGSLIFLQVLG